MRKLISLISMTRASRLLCGLMVCLLFTSCSTQARIPTVSDEAIELLVRNEAEQIVAVSEDKNRFSAYEIFLSDFPRKDILGMSIGKRRIYISYELAKLASRHTFHLWLLRQTLAHEIAHETAGHAKQTGSSWFNRGGTTSAVTGVDVGLPWNVKFRNYSMDKELEADSKGLRYWEKLGWDCRIWMQILKNFERENYSGDIFHPTDRRLRQAEGSCPVRAMAQISPRGR